MPRVAIRIAYDGTRFSGSQRQPEVRTVDRDLLAALRKLEAIRDAPEASYQSASRTDKGVSAAGNVIAFDTAFRRDALLPALGAGVEDIWPHAICEVPEGFDARRARGRTYRYFLRAAPEFDLDLLRTALRRFEGRHDFRRFARIEPGVDPVRTVRRIEARAQGELAEITVEGESFLWNQVRRMVSAARGVANADAPLEAIDRALRGEPVDLGLAPAEGLVLFDVDHGLAWQGHAAAREAALRAWDDRMAGLVLQQAVLQSMRSGLRP